ncbi:MAG: serine proteinase protein [Rhodocyclaceae bacterium]|nr:serine proteinase protein [Rhodocyclaceae bacterium]
MDTQGFPMSPRTVFAALAAAAGASLLAPVALADLAKVKEVEEKPVIVFPDGTPGRPAFLKTIKGRFETPPAKVGEMQQGWMCARSSDILWNSPTHTRYSTNLFRIFRAELEKAHYPLPKVSDAIFEEPKAKKPNDELHVGLLFKEVAMNFCSKGSEGTQGGVYLKIFWQVYAPDAQKVVFETTTEGSFQAEEVDKASMTGFFDRAFTAAARNFLAEKGFYDAVANTQLAAAPTTPEILRLKGAKAGTDPLAKNVTMLRAAVATVFGDTGSGTGFFVSGDGHLLTNYHVVGAARFVKVKLTTGRELVGEVVRSDRKQDVALVKTEPINLPPISLRINEPNIGEDVFALGSPLGEKFNTTLTKGILSGYRTVDDNRYLQSDVAILPGNSGGPLLDAKGSVVGITVAGLGSKGLAGMNFFIPINDALAKLKLEFE